MSYDLRRLRLHGLIRRLPHSNTYVLTLEGIRIAVFYTKLQTGSCDRSYKPTDHPRPPTSAALGTLERAINDYLHSARLTPAP
jgi:hypothetical protein